MRRNGKNNRELFSFDGEPPLLPGAIGKLLTSAAPGEMPVTENFPQPSCEQLEVSSGSREQAQLTSGRADWEGPISTGPRRTDCKQPLSKCNNTCSGILPLATCPWLQGFLRISRVDWDQTLKREQKMQPFPASFSFLPAWILCFSLARLEFWEALSLLQMWDVFCHKLGVVWDYAN